MTKKLPFVTGLIIITDSIEKYQQSKKEISINIKTPVSATNMIKVKIFTHLHGNFLLDYFLIIKGRTVTLQ